MSASPYPDYADLGTALAAAKRFARTPDTDTMRDFLYLTRGAEPQEEGKPRPYYRPMHAAALFLQANPEHVRVLGGGADRLEYESPLLSQATLLQLQAKEDARLKLIVPLEYQLVSLTTRRRPFAGVST